MFSFKNKKAEFKAAAYTFAKRNPYKVALPVVALSLTGLDALGVTPWTSLPLVCGITTFGLLSRILVLNDYPFKLFAPMATACLIGASVLQIAPTPLDGYHQTRKALEQTPSACLMEDLSFTNGPYSSTITLKNFVETAHKDKIGALSSATHTPYVKINVTAPSPLFKGKTIHKNFEGPLNPRDGATPLSSDKNICSF